MKTEFICDLHNEALEVGISKPLSGQPPREITYMNKQFPYNGIYSIQPSSEADKGQVELYCPSCKKAALEYIKPFWEKWERAEEEGKLE